MYSIDSLTVSKDEMPDLVDEGEDTDEKSDEKPDETPAKKAAEEPAGEAPKPTASASSSKIEEVS